MVKMHLLASRKHTIKKRNTSVRSKQNAAEKVLSGSSAKKYFYIILRD